MAWYKPCTTTARPPSPSLRRGRQEGVMEPIGELLAVDERRALEFFAMGLQDVSESKVDRQELLYNASVLAHYAHVSVHTELEMPAPEDLSAIFDQFVVNSTLPDDSHLMETAGAQC